MPTNTEKEYEVANAKTWLAKGESELRTAQRNLSEGFKKLNAKVEQAKAEMEAEYAELKEKVIQAESERDKRKAFLEWKEAELARGFEK